MSLAALRSRALAGMEAPAVSVGVHLANGLPAMASTGTTAPYYGNSSGCIAAFQCFISVGGRSSPRAM